MLFIIVVFETKKVRKFYIPPDIPALTEIHIHINGLYMGCIFFRNSNQQSRIPYLLLETITFLVI